jgi:hypothetical protein
LSFAAAGAVMVTVFVIVAVLRFQSVHGEILANNLSIRRIEQRTNLFGTVIVVPRNELQSAIAVAT